MLRLAVTMCLVLIARGIVMDSVGNILNSALGVILHGGHPPVTVTELVDSKYLGRWYQWPISADGSLKIQEARVTNVITKFVDNRRTSRWFQMYASESVALTFERNAVCVTADYGVSPDGRITVLNSDRLGAVNGSLDVIHGYATKTDIMGRLTVNLETVPVAAPYWVIKLGPATYGPEGQYQYSVVTDNLKATLFVLARDVEVFQRDYEQEVLAFLTEQGFTSALNKPIKTLHNDQCLYNAVPAS